jgi:transposase
MIRIDTIWLATEPMDMRAGTETSLAKVIGVFGAAKPHCAYLFANRRATRMKVRAHDAIGFWLAARRLNQGNFIGLVYDRLWNGAGQRATSGLGARFTLAKGWRW